MTTDARSASMTTDARSANTTTDHIEPAPAVDRDWYAWLIDPLPTAEFERDYYEQRLLHVPRAAPSYYAELLSVADLDVVLGTHSAGHRDISLVRGDGNVPTGEYTNDAGRVHPLEVARFFDGGATVVFNQLHKRVPALARLCVALGRRFSSRVQTNVYLTPPDAQGFASHWDTHDVFVLQVSGTKRWTIYDTKVRLPLRGQRFEPGTPPGDVSDEFELGPGSAVYLPRGLMHAARSTGEASLHVTLGLTAFTWAEFLVESVTAAALEEESLRRNLPRGFAGEGLPAAERERLFDEKLALVRSRLDPEAVWRRFADEVLATDVPLFTDLLGQRLRRDPLTPRSRVRRRAGLLTEAVTEGGTCLLRFCGRELRLPVGVWPALQFATTAGEFAVEDLPDCLDAEGKLTLVARLVREGILQRAPASS
jgi:ribosomal protein L16 Arg81 hydroxylase